MTIAQWRQIGVFAALVLGVSLVDTRLALILCLAAGGVILVTHAGQLVTMLSPARGGGVGPK